MTSSNEPMDAQPYVFPSANAAIDAILALDVTPAYRRILDLPEPPSPIDWPAAARIIRDTLEPVFLTPARLKSLLEALPQVPDRECANAIRMTVRSWVEGHWALFEDDLRLQAIKLFANDYSSFENFVGEWPLLASDRALLANVLTELRRDPTRAKHRIARLKALVGSRAAASEVLAVLVPVASSLRQPQDFASLVAHWAGDTSWGQLQHLIWGGSTERGNAQATPIEIPQSVLDAFDLLDQLDLSVCARRSENPIRELSAETRAAWRRKLRATVDNLPDLRMAVTEVLLWFGRSRDEARDADRRDRARAGWRVPALPEQI